MRDTVVVQSRHDRAPLVFGDDVDGDVIEVVAQSVVRGTRIGQVLWITGSGAEEAIDAGYFRRVDPAPVTPTVVVHDTDVVAVTPAVPATALDEPDDPDPDPDDEPSIPVAPVKASTRKRPAQKATAD